MRYKRLILWGILSMIGISAYSADSIPERWTLRSCLEYALANNISIQQSNFTLQSGLEDTKEAKAQMFPSLAGSITQSVAGYPSNERTSKNSYVGDYGINASWTIYKGNQRKWQIYQTSLQNQVDETDVEYQRNQVRLALIEAYLQIMYAQEAVAINRNTVEVSKSQMERSSELYRAGSISKADYMQIESQYSTDQYTLVVSESTLANYKLQLKQLLELGPAEQIEISSPQLSDTEVLQPVGDKLAIYGRALEVMPEILGSKLSEQIAQSAIQKAKSGYLPSISVKAGLGTGHLSGTDYSFGNQLWNRFNTSAGLTLSIPIASNRANRTAVNKAQIAYSSAQLDALAAEKKLMKEVESSYLDATSAQTQYRSAQQQLRAVEESYKLVEEQFFLGMKNTVELLTEKNNLLTARQQVLQSKYMAVMNILSLDVYQGKNINVNY